MSLTGPLRCGVVLLAGLIACGRSDTFEELRFSAAGGGKAAGGGPGGGGARAGGSAGGGGAFAGGGGAFAGGGGAFAGGGGAFAGGGGAFAGGGAVGGGSAGAGTGGGVIACPEGTQTLAQARASIVGKWQGSWTANYQVDPVQVTISFDATGTYVGRASTPGRLAFGYGTDGESPFKKYTLDNLKANGDAAGIIAIDWGTGSTTQGELDNVRFCNGGQRMDFVFYPAWISRNPHWYRLSRL